MEKKEEPETNLNDIHRTAGQQRLGWEALASKKETALSRHLHLKHSTTAMIPSHRASDSECPSLQYSKA